MFGRNIVHLWMLGGHLTLPDNCLGNSNGRRKKKTSAPPYAPVGAMILKRRTIYYPQGGSACLG